MSYHYGNSSRPPVQVRMPFLRQATGLGDVVKRATSAVGIKPCGGCEQRAAWLNRHVRVVPRRRGQ